MKYVEGNYCFTKLFYPEGEKIVRRSLDKWEQDLSKNFSLLLSSEIIDDWNYQLLLLMKHLFHLLMMMMF